MAVPSTRPTAARGLGWSTSANIALRLGNFAVGVVMARLLAPEQFGVFAVALTVWTILGTLAEFGFGTDLVRATDPIRRAPAVGMLGLLSCGALGVGMALAAPLLATAFESPQAAPVLRLMAVSLGVFGLTIVPAALLQREYRQGRIFLVNGIALVTSAMIMIPLGLGGLGAYALAIGQIATQLVVAVGLHLAARHRPQFRWNTRIAGESLRFCAPLAVANLLSWVLISVDNLIVARALTPIQLGLYVLAFNVSSWPMNAIGQAVRVVALPGFAQHGSETTRNLTLARAIGPLWAVGLLIGVLLATGARPGITLLYGKDWIGAAVPLVGLALFGAVRVGFDLLATFLIAVGRTREVLVVQVAWLVGMVPSMYVSVRLFGLVGAGFAHLVVAIAIPLPLYLYFLHRASVPVRQLLRGCLVPTIVVLPLAAAAWWTSSTISWPLPAVLAAAGLAALLYGLPLSRWWLRRIHALRTAPLTSSALESGPSA
ncbi:oligosaccharide flippase family protein [Microlunatus soli]|nr:oligosaccharide flippase family protein [Microlunatus soli]